MRSVLMTILLAVLLLGLTATAAERMKVDPQQYITKDGFLGYVPDRFIVVMKDDVKVDHKRDVVQSIALSEVEGIAELSDRYEVREMRPQFVGADKRESLVTKSGHRLSQYYKVSFDKGTLEEAMAAYEALPSVDHVEPIGIHTLYATPNDGYYTDQWGYYDTYGIEADQAWDLETGAGTVLVGDLDIGTMYDHGDLGGSNPPGPNDNSTNGNIWVNSGEIVGNGIDDDGNGYVDDIIGWDFVASTDWYVYNCNDIDCGGADNDPSDGNGHGTHTAGTIAAITNNGYAVSGVAGGYGDGTFAGGGNGVKVVPCRIGYQLSYLGQDVGVVIMDYVAEAMYYMADLKTAGWNVASINCSFGTSNSGGLGAAADYLISQDVVICVAAGNSSSSSADYLGSRGDCIDVGAIDVNGNPASFTNYGSWVDIAAPGVDILSTMTDPTDPGVDYIASIDGTSMACPHVAGAIALMESYDPSLSATDKINIILDPANMKSYNQTRDLGDGALDLRACLDAIGPSDQPPVAEFNGSPTSGYYPLNVNFTDLSSNTPTSWSWDFGDGGSSSAQNPSHTYTSAGTYTVTLTAYNAFGSDSEVKSAYITVSAPPAPTAEFSGTPTSGDAPLTVDFTDLSTDNPTSWSWDFGDGGTSLAQNPSHTYNDVGIYTVTLTASNANGSDAETKTNYITVNEPGSGYASLPYSTGFESGVFDQYWFTQSDNSEGRILITTANTPRGSYHMTMDDNLNGGSYALNEAWLSLNMGGASEVDLTFWWKEFSDEDHTQDGVYFSDNGGASFVKVYSLIGGSTTYQQIALDVDQLASANGLSLSSTFVIKFQQYDNYGITTDGMAFDDISVVSNDVAPTAAFVGSPTSGNFPLEVSFTDQSSGNPTSWNWDFGDGGTSTTQSPSHTYTAAGTYTVTLTATNAFGSDSEVKTNYITVTTPPAPTAEFSGTPTSGTYPLNVTFTDASTDGPTSWSWDFGDGGTSTAQNPSHTYVDAGIYTVTLTATNAYGSDSEVKTNYITVTAPPPPTAEFSATPTSGYLPLLVSFTDLSTGGPTSWSWDFGDGGTSTAQNPTHTYNSAGSYTVTLIATNAYGSDDEIKTAYITVSEAGSGYAVLPYSTGFESGDFDEFWFTQSDNAEGRILITSANTPRGTYHMTMDDNLNGGSYALNEAWLSINMGGAGDVELSFWWKEFSDEDHTQDGVYFSDDGGASFTKVYSLVGGSSTYQEIVLDVDQLASANGLSLSSTFVIKFQQYDNYSIATDGMAFDDVSVTSNEAPPAVDFVGTPTSGAAPLAVAFTDASDGNPTSWSWDFGDGGTSTAQNPSHTYTATGTYTVVLTATNAYGSASETKTNYITVVDPSAWVTITYDDFESGWGTYTDGGGDCARYVGGTYAHQGIAALDIQDNSGVASSFYHTSGYDVSGYTELEVEFWFYAWSMDNVNEDFWVQYYDGSTWQTVATYARSIDFDNNVFYNEVVTISSSQYNFPTNARLRFMCDASGNQDDVYIDEIEFRGLGGGTSGLNSLASYNPLPYDYSLSQNYPNPFNPTTTIEFSLPSAAHVRLEVFNILGQNVETLVNESVGAGPHSVEWDASDVASGIYLYRLVSEHGVETRKMLFLK